MNEEKYFNELWDKSPMGRIGCGAPITFACIIILCVVVLCSCATKKQIEYVDRVVTEHKTNVICVDPSSKLLQLAKVNGFYNKSLMNRSLTHISNIINKGLYETGIEENHI